MFATAIFLQPTGECRVIPLEYDVYNSKSVGNDIEELRLLVPSTFVEGGSILKLNPTSFVFGGREVFQVKVLDYLKEEETLTGYVLSAFIIDEEMEEGPATDLYYEMLKAAEEAFNEELSPRFLLNVNAKTYIGGMS